MIYNKIICADCINIIEGLNDRSVDLVITSPPYNVDLGNNKYNRTPYDLYSDNKDHAKYIEWIVEVFCETLQCKMKPGGRICINIGDGKNGAIPTHADILRIFSHFYFPMTTIIWDKGTTSNRTAWGSFMSPSCPSFPRGFEYILVFGHTDKKLINKGETDITKEEFIQFSNGLWRIRPETRQKKWGHPAMFPEEIPYRLIKMLSWKNSFVLDPFCGAGTTCVVAKKLGRKYLGVDISEQYCEIARKRIDDIE